MASEQVVRFLVRIRIESAKARHLKSGKELKDFDGWITYLARFKSWNVAFKGLRRGGVPGPSVGGGGVLGFNLCFSGICMCRMC